MANRSRDLRWRDVRRLYEALGGDERGIVLTVSLSQTPAVLRISVWDEARQEYRTYEVQADTRWQYVTEWLLDALYEVQIGG